MSGSKLEPWAVEAWEILRGDFLDAGGTLKSVVSIEAFSDAHGRSMLDLTMNDGARVMRVRNATVLVYRIAGGGK